MTDAEKLRALADWHDVQDDKRGYTEGREVQVDLRRIADKVESYDNKMAAMSRVSIVR